MLLQVIPGLALLAALILIHGQILRRRCVSAIDCIHIRRFSEE